MFPVASAAAAVAHRARVSAHSIGSAHAQEQELGDLAAATQFYLKAIKLKPRFTGAYNNLALCYVQVRTTNHPPLHSPGPSCMWRRRCALETNA